MVCCQLTLALAFLVLSFTEHPFAMLLSHGRFHCYVVSLMGDVVRLFFVQQTTVTDFMKHRNTCTPTHLV